MPNSVFHIEPNLILGLLLAEGLRQTCWYHDETNSIELAKRFEAVRADMLVDANVKLRELTGNKTATITIEMLDDVFELYKSVIELSYKYSAFKVKRTTLSDAMMCQTKLREVNPGRIDTLQPPGRWLN